MNKLFVIVIAFFTFNSNAQLIDTNFTNPKCAAYGDKPRNAFCTRADLPLAQRNPSGPYQKILKLINNKANRHITLGTMTFSHKDVSAALCQAVKNGVGVTVLIDAGAEMATADQVAACGGQVFKVGTAETEEARGDLHHNKFLIAEGSEETTVVFATANFSNPGLTINHESWTFVTDKNDSAFVLNHKCLAESVKGYTSDMNRFKQDLAKCRVRSQGKIESLFVPADSTRLVSLIEQGFKTSSRVLLTSNRYSFDRITKAYRSSPSKDSRALFDDDLYWGGIQPTDEYPTEKVDAVKVAQLEKAGVKVKFMQTSMGAAQKMHSKFIVFDDFVVVGAGNYTASGMMSNFENFYVIRDAKVVEEFRAQFEYLWAIGSFRNQMPKDYTDPGKRE